MRRGLGRGRTLIGIGAVTAILGVPLAWLKVGGIVLSSETANGFEGPGILVFLASLAMLALIVLPYTSRSGESALDRPLAYVGLLAVGLVGLVAAAAEALGAEGSSMVPTDVPGLWLAGAGIVLVAWGVAELFAEPGRSL